VAENGELLGKFMLYFDAVHDWSDGELQLARTIARQVSFAIARHERLAQLRDSVAEQERLFREASEANRAKSVFLATMSHELRTPLNAIAGYADLLDAGVHGDMPDRQRDAVQRIQANQRHLLRLIDDVLDFAKLEAGHLQLEIADVPVQETLEGTRVLIEPQMRARDITCRFGGGDMVTTCRADRAKMQQILVNLLSNATKFTPHGGSVSVDWEADDDFVRVHVRDSGPGIDNAHLETIFEPFVQLQAGLRRRVEGTGLGLAISRELARGMGADVTAASSIGQGSTFTLALRRR
jgi:signal transduction histidine kinase